MAFRFKDLMITVVGEGACAATPGGTGCLGGTICVASDCQGTGICRGTPAHCLVATGFGTGGFCEGTGVCRASPIGCVPTNHAMLPFPCCFLFTGICTAGTNKAQLSGNVDDQLGELKAQLQQAVAEIEDLEKNMKERAAPRTVAEIEELEGKLEEAMAELKKRKSELRKE